MKSIDLGISKDTLSAIPDPLASDSEKKTKAYGLKYATVIAQEWFNGGLINSATTFTERHEWVREMRLYNRGEQDIEQDKKHLARQENDLTYLNLDFTPINTVESYTNRVRNGITDDYYKIDVRSIDKFATIEKKDKILKHKANMAAKPMLEKAKEIFGIDLTEKGFIPEDEEELTLYNEIKERPKREIAEEIVIDFVKKTNNWSFIKKETDKDLVVVDLQVVRVYTDPNDGIKMDYVDPECYGHSFVERNNFSDAFYHFTVDTVTINDIRRESDFDNTTLRDIAKLYGTANQLRDLNFSTCSLNEILDFQIHVMRFCFKSDKEIVYKKYHDKKNNVRKVAKRDSNYQVPEGSEKSRLSKRLDTWYEGSYIVGSQKYLYNYKECENLAKDQMNKVLPPFIVQSTNIYRNKLRSFLSNLIPIANQLQRTGLKIQHLAAELKPDLTLIDIDQLAEINTDTKGGSKSNNWQHALSILNVKGVVLQQRVNMGEDGIKDGAAAKPMGSQQGSALGALLNIWAHYSNLMRETTGLNPVDSNGLVGVNEMIQLSNNTSTKHIVDASVSFDKRICETISARVKGIFTFKEAIHIRELYEQAIGKHNMEALETYKNRHIHEYGFTIEMMPTKEELDELRQDLSIALQEQSIDVSEKAEIMRVARNNMKQAHQYMSFIRKRKIKEKMKQVEYNQKLQSQSNAQAAEAKAQAEMQLYAAKKEIDLKYHSNYSGITLQEKQAIQEMEAPGKEKEFKQKVYMEELKNYQTISMTKYKEDEKRSREKQSDTRQSELIDQRNKDKDPIDFDGKFDFSKIYN
jgi:hypothetical protein